MRPEDAVNFTMVFGPYHGKTIGWIAKVMGVKGLNWLLRQYETAALRTDSMEAIRSFFAAPKYKTWLAKVMPSYPGAEAFWLPEGHKGCRACACQPVVCETALRCEHGTQRGLAIDMRCSCGWRDYREVRFPSLRRHCQACDEHPTLFPVRSAGG